MGRLIVLLALLASNAQAGAWPREKGRFFVTASSRVAATNAEGPFSVYSTTYLEYGMSERLTVGLDMGHGVSGSAKTIVFARLPIGSGTGAHRFAGELGIGKISGENVLRPGFSYGYGFTTKRGKSGWFAVDTVAEFHLESGLTDFKADITYGRAPTERLKLIMQVQTGLSSGDPSFIRLAPSAVVKVSDKAHIELGMTAGLLGDRQIGVKLSLWRSF